MKYSNALELELGWIRSERVLGSVYSGARLCALITSFRLRLNYIRDIIEESAPQVPTIFQDNNTPEKTASARTFERASEPASQRSLQ